MAISDNSPEALDIGNINIPYKNGSYSTTFVRQIVRQRTVQWCETFVADLGLCPWARQSLLKEDCTKIMIIQDPKTPQELERFIRDAARDLLKRTRADNENPADPIEVKSDCERVEEKERKFHRVDPDYAITFIVVAPSHTIHSSIEYDKSLSGTLAHDSKMPVSPSNNDGWFNDFETFYNFVNQVESDWFDKADEGIDSIGDVITLAGFHPQWVFASSGSEDNNDDPSPVDYEKRSPYPTISLVLTEAIHRLTGNAAGDENDNDSAIGEEATHRIAVNNERILQQMGLATIRQYYNDKVLALASMQEREND